jgi:hypothetical protein
MKAVDALVAKPVSLAAVNLKATQLPSLTLGKVASTTIAHFGDKNRRRSYSSNLKND